MNESLLLFLAIALVLAVRLWPSWRNPVIGPDAGTHLLLRREVRKNGFRAPRKLEPCLFDRRLEYPWLYHQFIALFPESWLLRLPALPSALMDGAHTALVFFAARRLGQNFFPDVNPVLGAGLAALLYGLNPALLARGIGPRAYEITSRPFGEFLFTASLGCALLAFHTGAPAWAAGAVLAGAGVFLSSKFALQAMMFFAPALSLLPGLGWLWLLPAASFLVALLLSGGRYYYVLRGQIRHLTYYMKKLQYTFGVTSDRNRWQDVSRLMNALRVQGLFSRAAADFYFGSTYLQMMARGVIFLLLVVLLAGGPAMGGADPGARHLRWLVGWAFVWIIPFLLTSWRHARFLGEAERYAEFSVAPAAMLAGLLLWRGTRPLPAQILLALLAVSALCTLAHAVWSAARETERYRACRHELAEFLKTLPAGSVLLGIPQFMALGPIAYLLPHRYADITFDMKNQVYAYEHHNEGFPWPKPDWAFWRAAGVQYLVALQPSEIQAQRPGLNYDFGSLELLFSNGTYCVFKLVHV